MVLKSHTATQLLWFKAAHLTIAQMVREKMKNAQRNSAVMDHLSWRLGFNLYSSGSYEEAMPILQELVLKEDICFSDDANITSTIHQIAGRCAVYLFRQNKEHAILEKAYIHYQNAVQTMVINLYTMFKLPLLLLEFGRVLEDYGAFQAANEVYTKILSGFPNFRGYFDALYRSAVVGRHLASLHEDEASKEEALNKCLDVLQFLLEALPSTICDVRLMYTFFICITVIE